MSRVVEFGILSFAVLKSAVLLWTVFDMFALSLKFDTVAFAVLLETRVLFVC